MTKACSFQVAQWTLITHHSLLYLLTPVCVLTATVAISCTMAAKFNQIVSVVPFILLVLNSFSSTRLGVRVAAQGIYASPPPPYVCQYPCLPPPTATTNCPPPPSPPAVPTVSPPPPSGSNYYPPPPFGYYFPSPDGYLPFFPPPEYVNNFAPPPPDPILPYFPFYYMNPPPPDFASGATSCPLMTRIVGMTIILFSTLLLNYA